MKAFLLLAFLLVFTPEVSPIFLYKVHHSPFESKSIVIASYNTWGLPIRIPGHDQGSRFKKIPEVLSNLDVDILCLQETFSKRLRHPLADSLSKKYFSYSDYNCNKSILGPWVRDCYGGLMTWSKFPIIDEVFIPYSRVDGMNIEERIGSKGFLISAILTPSQQVYVVNTHLYSGMDEHAEWIRHHQITELQAELEKDKYNGSPVILAGDFNIAHPSVAAMYDDINPSMVYSKITRDLEFYDSNPVLDESGFTIDHRRNIYQKKVKPLQRLDYVFFKEGHNSSSVCIENQGLFLEELNLSDHLGWQVQFSFSDQPHEVFTSLK